MANLSADDFLDGAAPAAPAAPATETVAAAPSADAFLSADDFLDAPAPAAAAPAGKPARLDPLASAQAALQKDQDNTGTMLDKAVDWLKGGKSAAREEQLARLGAARVQKATIPERTTGEAVADVVTGVRSGFNSLGKTIPGAVQGLVTGDMASPQIKAGKAEEKRLDAQMSAPYQLKKKAAQQTIDDAEGVAGKMGAAFTEYLTDPALFTTELAKQLPNFGVMGVAGRLASVGTKMVGGAVGQVAPAAGKAIAGAAGTAGTAAAVGTGAVMQGADVAEGVYTDLVDPKKISNALWQQQPAVQQLMAEGKSFDEAKQTIAMGLTRKAAAAAGLLSLGVNAIPGAAGFERALVGAAAKKSAAGGIIGRVALPTVMEPATEALEEGGGALFGNVAKQQVNPNQALDEGVGQAMGQAAAVSIGPGLVGGIAAARAGEPAPALPVSPPLSGAPGQTVITPGNSAVARAGLTPIVVPNMPAPLPAMAGQPTDAERLAALGETVPISSHPTATNVSPVVNPAAPAAPAAAAPNLQDSAGNLVNTNENTRLPMPPGATIAAASTEENALRESLVQRAFDDPKSLTPRENAELDFLLERDNRRQAPARAALQAEQEATLADPIKAPGAGENASASARLEAAAAGKQDDGLGNMASAAGDFGSKIEIPGAKSAPAGQPIATGKSLFDEQMAARGKKRRGELLTAAEIDLASQPLALANESATIALPETRRQKTAPESPRIDPKREETGTAGTAATEPTVDASEGSGMVLQNRDRNSVASVQQMNSIAKAPDYGRLSVSRDFANGAPVVFSDSDLPATAIRGKQSYVAASDGRRIDVEYAVVEASDLLASNQADGTPNADYARGQAGKLRAVAGNGRVAGLQAAYKRGTTEAYRTELAGDVDHGVDAAAIAGMTNPVLVRIMDRGEVTADIGDVSNTTGTAQLSPLEQAQNDARRIDISALQFNEEGGLSRLTVSQFIQSMPVAERSAMLGPDGGHTRQAEDRLMAAIFHEAYGDPELVALYAQASDPEAKAVLNALAAAAPQMVQLKDAGEFDIRAVVTEAAQGAVNARRRGEKLADYAKSKDMNRSGDGDAILDFMAANIRSSKRMGEGLQGLAQGMLDASVASATDSMFADLAPAGRGDVMGKFRGDNGQTSNESTNQGNPESASRPGDAESIPRVEGRADDQPASGSETSSGTNQGAEKADDLSAVDQAVVDRVIPAEAVELEYDGAKPFASKTAASLFRDKNKLEAEAVEDGQGGWVLQPTNSRMPQEARKEEKRLVADLNDMVRDQAGGKPVAPVFDNPTADIGLARAVAKIFGIPLSIVTNSDLYEGVKWRDRIFISTGSISPIIAITGHEATHTLEGTPEHAALLQHIDQYLKAGAVEGRRLWDNDRRERDPVTGQFVGAEMTTAVAKNEVIADLSGSMWMDPQFWQSMVEKDVNLFRRVAYQFLKVATKAMQAIQGSNFDAGKYVDDIAAVRELVATAWASHLQNKPKTPKPADSEKSGELEARAAALQPQIDALTEAQVMTVAGKLQIAPNRGRLDIDRLREKIAEEHPEDIEAALKAIKPGERTNSLGKTSSWVIKELGTGRIIGETFDRKKVDMLNKDKYEAVPILEHLQSLNQEETKPAPKPKAKAKPAPDAGTTGYERAPDPLGPLPADVKTYSPKEAEAEWKGKKRYPREIILARINRRDDEALLAKEWADMTPAERKDVTAALNEDFHFGSWYINKAGTRIDRIAMPAKSEQQLAVEKLAADSAKWDQLDRYARHRLLVPMLGAGADQGQFASWNNLANEFRDKLAPQLDAALEAEKPAPKVKAPRKPRAKKTDAGVDSLAKPADVDQVAFDQAKLDAMAALADLGNILGKFSKKETGLSTEEEAKLLPVLTRLIDATMRMGKVTFKDSVNASIGMMRQYLGDQAAAKLSLDNLQAAYINAAGRYADKGADSKKSVINDYDALADVLDEENANALNPADDSQGTSADLQEPGTANSVFSPDIESDGASRADGAAADETRIDAADSPSLFDSNAAPVGERGNQPVRPGETGSRIAQLPAGSNNGGRGNDAGNSGNESAAAGSQAPAAPAGSGSRTGSGNSLADKIAAQRAADSIEVIPGDAANIAATLPFLLPGQQSDVLFAETRFARPDAAPGVMFTNGTGTGKTYTGLGILKRMHQGGKKNVLIAVPNNEIAQDWIDSAKNLNLSIKLLDGLDDNGGAGIVITTYANLGANETLADRDFDAVFADEAHYLSANEAGERTDALRAVQALTKHPDGMYAHARMKLRAEYAKLAALEGVNVPAYDALRAKISAKEEALREAYAPIAQNPKARPVAVMLSASPFAYVKNVDYANGYLFDYGNQSGSGYNSGDGRERFFMQHFGYRMRYNKLTTPDGKVDESLMARQFNSWLKKEGALSGRMLEVAADYDRKFIMVPSALGSKIDEGLEFLHANKQYELLARAINKRFDYLSRRYLLEAIKASEVLPTVRAHLALGRKVVIVHDYKKGGGSNPFSVQGINGVEHSYNQETGKQESVDLADLAAQFAAERPDLQQLNIPRASALETLQRAFPDALIHNGSTPKKQLQLNKVQFNDDRANHDIIILQSDKGREGISLHDTTGKKMRVMVNIGLPSKPTAVIQLEGRTYRTGQVSDAAFRYANTGTSWERNTFAETIAGRADTAEALAMGEQARGLRESIIEAFENSDDHPVGDEDGKGGKARDRTTAKLISAWDRAKTFYFGQGKKTSKNKAAEGKDYFATPEPIGLKMVEFADVLLGEDVLEPSAGHGAVARWLPGLANKTIIEPSTELLTRTKLLMEGNTRFEQQRFEDHHISNKYHAIVMNPPYGLGGSVAIPHLAKAARHLREGGRIVALLPRGPSADAKLDKFLASDEAKDLYTVADMQMPASTFERAGTGVMTHILVLEKQADPMKAPHPINYDFTNAEDINALFERMENISLPGRVHAVSPLDVALEETKPARPKGNKTTPGERLAAQMTDKATSSDSSGLFTTAEFMHSKTGETMYQAAAKDRVGTEQYKELLAVAKKNGGWYSKFNGGGAVRGFLFKSEGERSSFMREAAESDAFDAGSFSRKDQTGTPAFRKWFSDSKVVDGAGNPLVVFHGTTSSFDAFDPNVGPYHFAADQGLHFFYKAAKSASEYAESMGDAYGGEANVMPAYLALKNPWIKVVDKGEPSEQWDYSRGAFMEAMRAGGHDGAIVSSKTEAGVMYVATGPTQIKSAVGNNGQFDGSNPDIRFARKQQPQAGQDGFNFDAEPAAKETKVDVAAEDWRPGAGPAGTMKREFSATVDGKKVGRLLLYRDLDGTFDLSDIGVFPNAQKQGVATQLVDAAFEETGAEYLKLTTGTTGDGSAFFGRYGEVKRDGKRVVARPDRLSKAAPVKIKPGQVFHDGEVWDVLSKGAKRDGQVYTHLASTTKFREQRNGQVPQQIADWVPLEAFDQVNEPGARPAAAAGFTGRSDTGMAPEKRFMETALEAGRPLTKQEVLQRQLDDQRAAAREAAAAAAPAAPARRVTADQVDLFNTQGGLFSRREDIPARRRDITETVAFKKWFGDSVVVDDNGDPRVVYHGTGGDFNEFKNAYTSRGWNMFSSDPAYSNAFAGRGGNVMPMYVSLQNPLDLTSLPAMRGDVRTRLIRVMERAGIDFPLKDVPIERDLFQIVNLMGHQTDFARAVQAAGFDGIVMPDVLENMAPDDSGDGNLYATTFITFESAQSKSATGNNGDFDASNQDIRFSRRPGQALPEETSLVDRQNFGKQKQQRYTQDYFRRMTTVQETIKAQGGNLTDAIDTYLAEERMPGRIRAAVEDLQQEVLEPFVAHVAKAGLELDEVATYLYALHAPERNRYIASINPKFPDGGSGMTNADAAAIIARAASEGKTAALDQAASMLHGVTEATRLMQWDQGLISDEQFNAWSNQYGAYVPLRGFEGVDEAGSKMPGGRGFNIRGEESLRAMGRRSRAADLIENIFSDYERAVSRSERNNVAKTFLDFVLANPDPGLWEIDKTDIKQRMDPVTGLVRQVKMLDKGEDTIGVKIAGKVVYIKIKDPLLARAMKMAGKDESGDVERFLAGTFGAVNSMLRAAYTKYNPLFIPVNAIRDVQSGAVGMVQKQGFLQTGKYLLNYPVAMRFAFRGLTGRGNQSRLDLLYSEFKHAGGITGGYFRKDPKELRDELRSLLLAAGAAPKGLGERVRGNVAWRSVASLFKAIELMGEVSENATRFAAYMTAREGGTTIAQSASLAKNLTTNFDRKGEWGSGLSSLYLFYNAGIQGTTRMIEAIKNPKVQALMLGLTGFTATVAMMNAGLGGDDDDGQAYWDKIADEVKERNFILMLPEGVHVPGEKQVGKFGRYVMLPMPYGYNVFAVAGNALSDAVRHGQDAKRGKPIGKSVASVVSAMMGSFNPINGGIQVLDRDNKPQASQLLQQVTPTALMAFTQLATNKDFRGRDVAPVYRDEVKPRSERYFLSQTGSASQRMAEWMNGQTGGNRAKPGTVDIAPSQIDLVIRSYTGGIGTIIRNAVNSASQIQAGEPVDSRNVPLMNRFYGKVDGPVDQRLYYERTTETLEAYKRMVAALKMGIVADSDPESKAMQIVGAAAEQYQQAMSKFRQAEIAIINSRTLSDSEKTASRTQIAQSRAKLVDSLNKLYMEKVAPLK